MLTLAQVVVSSWPLAEVLWSAFYGKPLISPLLLLRAAGYEAMLGSNNFTGTVFAPVDQASAARALFK